VLTPTHTHTHTHTHMCTHTHTHTNARCHALQHANIHIRYCLLACVLSVRECRKCIFCDCDTVETEEHVVLHSSLCHDLRDQLFCVLSKFSPEFIGFSVFDKLIIILSNPIYCIIKESDKICKLILVILYRK
jgi:hypothetical protein